MSRYVRFAVPAVIAAVLVTAIAACGGDGGKENADPAVQILNDVGLEICSEKQISSTAVTKLQDFAGARLFLTAPDCSKKGPRTQIVAATFSSHEGVAGGAAAIKAAYPKAAVTTYKTLVIGVLGPNAQQVANEIKGQVKPNKG